MNENMREQSLPKESLQNPFSMLKRLLGYMLKGYRFSFFVVIICIIASSLATLRGTLFMRNLIDDYIIPLTKSDTPDFALLFRALAFLVLIYVIGIICTYAYNRIMVNITQGVMKKLRRDLFTHMETLPVKYFDTNAHGDIMSVYTNDVDTLRQLMNQSMPQLVNSAVTIVTTFTSMVLLNILLTVISVILVVVMMFSLSAMGKKSATYFVNQQKSLGVVNGYIEEMMAGQKVVKVFCHEEKSLEEFRKRNRELRESAYKANLIAGLMMLVNVSLGNVSYVLCTIAGAILALNGMWGLTLGTLVSFLTLNKNFTQPVTQISQQMNSIIMAMARAGRVFQMLEEKPEEDNGYVELVNAKENPDGTLTETKERTGLWAWRHPHKAEGTVTYTRLEGAVVLDGVDFGYNDDKMVLHDIELFAEPGQKIAFVGSTGAGKTTITNLLNRFYMIFRTEKSAMMESISQR